MRNEEDRWPYDVGSAITDPGIQEVPREAQKKYRGGLLQLAGLSKRLRSLLQVPLGDANIVWKPGGEPYDSTQDVLTEIDGVLRLMLADLDRVDEIVGLRLQDIELQRQVVNSWPRDELASLLTYFALGLLSAGTALFAYFDFPGLSPKLAPPALYWGSGLVLLLAGFAQLADWQSLRMHYFRKRMGVDSSALRRGAFGLWWIPVWMAIGGAIVGTAFAMALSVAR